MNARNANKLDKRVFLRAFRLYVKPHKKIIFWTVIVMIISAVATAASAQLIDPVVNKIFVNKDFKRLYPICALIIVVVFIKSGSTYLHRVLMGVLESKIYTNLSKDLFSKLVMLKMKDFETVKTGHIITYFNNDIRNVKQIVNAVIINFSKEILTIILLVGLMFHKSVILSCIALFGFPLAFLPLIKITRKLRRFYKLVLSKQENVNILLQNVFDSMKTVKSFCQEMDEKERMCNELNNLLNLEIRASKLGSIGSPMMEFMGGVAYSLVILYGGYAVINGEMTSGGFFGFLTCLLMLYKPIKSTSNMGMIFQNGYISLVRIFAILDMKQDLEYHKGIKEIDISSAEIMIKNLTFTYGNRSNPVLKNINLNIKNKEKIALVGESGSGKSTIVNLLLKLYSFTDGEILIHGQDIKEINTSILRQNISYVGQDLGLFDGTVLSNVTYGIKNYTEEGLKRALTLANCNSFIDQMPMKLEAKVGQSGSQLSTGQKQRLIIARAILKDAPIIIFDEATSALDNTTEKEIQQAMDALMQDRTTIIIAHRLQTITQCDTIYLMSNGEIVESGTHKDLLLREDSEYFKLWHRI